MYLPVDQELLEAIEGVSYVVSGDGVLCAIGSANWRRFADENRAKKAADPALYVGKPLKAFIGGEAVLSAYDYYLQQLLSGTQSNVSFTYRCDAPSLKRHMHLSITTIKTSETIVGFLFQNTLLSADRRPSMKIYDFDTDSSNDGSEDVHSLVGMCSFCQRLSLLESEANNAMNEDEWLDAETYYQRGHPSDVRVSHAVCPDCAVAIYGERTPVEHARMDYGSPH